MFENLTKVFEVFTRIFEIFVKRFEILRINLRDFDDIV